MKLVVGSIYLCSDGDIRRLDKIEDTFLSYSLPMGKRGSRVAWRDLGQTKRYQVESLFLKGKIISESEIDKL